MTETRDIASVLRALAPSRTRRALVLAGAAALLALLAAPIGDWQESHHGTATAAGLPVVIVAGQLGGLWVGLAAAALGWALNAVFVADVDLDAALAVPAWLAVGAIAGWASER